MFRLKRLPCIFLVASLRCLVTIPEGAAHPSDRFSPQQTEPFSGGWERQHPIFKGWNLTVVSAADSVHAWAAGWHDSAGGLVVGTTNGGKMWTELHRDLPQEISGICFVSDSLGWMTIRAFSAGSLLKSTDGGRNWVTQMENPNVRFRAVFFLDAARGWVVGDSGTILRTTDGGESWTEQWGGKSYGFQDVFFLPDGHGWAGGDGNRRSIVRTSDFGATWDSVSNIRTNALYFLNDSVGVAVNAFGTSITEGWRTADGGGTWSSCPYIVEVFLTDVVMLTESLVLATIWDARLPEPGFEDPYAPYTLEDPFSQSSVIPTRTLLLDGLCFPDSRHGFAVGLDDIVGSTDSGRTWWNQAGSLQWNLHAVDMIDDSTGWVVGDKGLILKTSNAGLDWVTQTAANWSDLRDVQAVDSNLVYACGDTFLVSSDGGATWTSRALPGGVKATALFFLNEQEGWVVRGGTSTSLLHTTNGGLDWSDVEGPAWYLMAVEFVDSLHGWCASSDIYRTTDGGLTWVQQTSLECSAALEFLDRDYGWTAGCQTLLKTTNGGADWDTSLVLAGEDFSDLSFATRDSGWAITLSGRIIATTDGGSTWIVQRAGGSSPYESPRDIDATTSSDVWIAGDGGSIFHTTDGGWSTSVGARAGGEMPGFELLTNYPNPFNGSTTITFGIKTPGQVKLTLYDMLGRVVALLAEDRFAPGRYQTQLQGSGLASGVYLLRLVSGRQAITKKVVILK